MDHIHMSYKDWKFLKKHFDTMDRYVLNTTLVEDEVIIDIFDEKIRDFLLDYKSMVIRKGMVREQYYNDDGLRMKRIYEQSVKPILKEEQ